MPKAKKNQRRPPNRGASPSKPVRSLTISGFRGFASLRIASLGHVNLITGKNGSGKTSILEALTVYASDGDVGELVDILSRRDEYAFGPEILAGSRSDARVSMERLFTTKSNKTKIHYDSLFIADTAAKRRVVISREWFEVSPVRASYLRRAELLPIPKSRKRIPSFAVPGITVRSNRGVESVPLSSLDVAAVRYRDRQRGSLVSGRVVYIPPSGLESQQIAAIWDSIALTDEEELANATLRTVFPDLERVSLIRRPGSDSNRIFVAKFTGAERPVPLRSLGDGAVRMFGLMLALVQARNGLLLIDEFENGLHFSILESIWTMLFRQVQRLNIQVFATTHSYDCIAHFSVVASHERKIDGRVLRVESDERSTRVVEIDEDELEFLTIERMELR